MGFGQTTGEVRRLLFPGARNYSHFHPASEDKVSSESLWSTITGLAGETVVFLGFVACCFREEGFFSTCAFGEGDIWLLWFVLERMGETQRAEEGREDLLLTLLLRLCKTRGLLCAAWRSPVENHLTLCGMFYASFMLCGMSYPVSFSPSMVILMPGTINKL